MFGFVGMWAFSTVVGHPMQELRRLFEFSGPNSSTPPLVLDFDKYNAGFVALLRDSLLKRALFASLSLDGSNSAFTA